MNICGSIQNHLNHNSSVNQFYQRVLINTCFRTVEFLRPLMEREREALSLQWIISPQTALIFPNIQFTTCLWPLDQ